MANTATKKITEEEKLKNAYNSAFAANAEEDPAKAVWDSLSYGYGQKAENINQSYDKAISQQDTSLLKRGMQRSSAGMQSLANLQTERNKALASNYDAMIADYNTRLSEMKDKEREQANWERSFEEGQRQFNENNALQKEQLGETKTQNEWQRNFQQEQADIAQKNTEWTQNFQKEQADIEQANTLWNQNFQKEQADIAQANTEWNQNFQKEQALINQANTEWEQQYKQNEAEANRANTEWEQRYREAEAARDQRNTEWNQNYQQQQADIAQENTLWNQNFQNEQFNYTKEKDATDLAYNREKDAEATRQWEAEFGETQKQNEISNRQNDIELAYNYVVSAAENGNDVTDELLERAGLSRSDFEALKKKSNVSSGGNTYNPDKDKGNTEEKPNQSTFESELDEDDVIIKPATTYQLVNRLAKDILNR